jgi:DNA-binding response OmpR family regulator
VDDNSMNRIMLSRYISKLGPVIMISAAEELESVVRCIELGAQDYLPKPFNPVLLRARLSECLERKRMRDQEIDYLQQVGRVTAAAAIRANTFQAGSLDEVARRSDELGQLAQVFQEMARQVSAREQHLQRQVQQLRIEIDQKRRAREVADITESEYFQQLLGKAEELRHRIKDPEGDGVQENAAKELEPGA